MKLSNYEILRSVKAPETEMPYGIQMIGAPLEWAETKGKGIKVAVLDTGCPQHPDIEVREAFAAKGLPNASPGDVYDHAGHATHVCGTIAANGRIKGVAPEVELYAAKVLGDTGGGDEDTICQGIYWAISKNVDIISMSLGGKSDQQMLHKAIQDAVNRGIVVVCAAGNAGDDWMAYPAKYEETIAVAAVDIEKQHPDFSSVGKEVEVAAAGVNVLSTWLEGKYAYLRGTSMACPHITGAVALLQAKAKIRYGRKLSPEQIRLLLHMYSEDVGEFGRDPEYGFGVFSFGRIKESDQVKHEIKLKIGSKKYWVDGIEKEMDVEPVLLDDRTMVPVRFVSEGVGDKVEWHPPETVVIRRG